MQRDPRLKRIHYLALIKEAEQSLAQAKDPEVQAHLKQVMNGYSELVRRLEMTENKRWAGGR